MASGQFGGQPAADRGPDIGRGYILQPGQVLLQAWRDRSLRVILQLGDGPPVPQLDPGWEVIPRARRVGLTEWTGRDPVRVAFPAMIDGLERNESSQVERACRTLEKLAGHRGGNTAPPRLMVDALGAIPHDFTNASHLKWVIEQIEWGDALRNRRGRRVRQLVDLVLLQDVEDEDEIRMPVVRKRQKTGGHGAGFTTARQGESLRDVAKRTGVKLAELKRLNGIRDGDRKLKRNQRIKLR